MTRFRRSFLALDDLLARGESILIAGLACTLIGVTFAQIVARYVFNDPLIWSEEAARYLFVWISMMGAARGLHEGAHANLDLMPHRLPPRLQKGLAAFVVFVTAVFLVVLFVTGVEQTQLTALQFATTLPITMDLPYLAIPVGSALMLIHLAAYPLRFGLVDIGTREIEI